MKLFVKTDTMTPELQGMIQKLSDPSDALMAVGKEVADSARDAFTNPSVRPSAWAPLKPATLKRKEKMKYGSEPLVASGVLARSPRVIYTVNKDPVVVGSDRRAGAYSLAAIHQHGAPKANIPARPFFAFDESGKATPALIDRVKAILLKWLNK